MHRLLLSAFIAIVTLVGVAAAFPRDQAAAIASQNDITAGGAGVFPAGASFQSIQLAGATYGIGVKTYSDGSAIGDLELQLNGTALTGLSQWITVAGWITTGTLNPDGTVTLNGTCSLDMGDGSVPASGVPLVANISASSVQVTVGATAIPALPKSDGWIFIE